MASRGNFIAINLSHKGLVRKSCRDNEAPAAAEAVHSASIQGIVNEQHVGDQPGRKHIHTAAREADHDGSPRLHVPRGMSTHRSEPSAGFWNAGMARKAAARHAQVSAK
jgi:hypothetical protein